MNKTPSSKLYSDEVIANALEVLKDNNYKVDPTAKQLGIPRGTLRRWVDASGGIPAQYKNPPKAPKATEIIITDESSPLLDRVLDRALQRTFDLIPQCKTAFEASTIAKNISAIKKDIAAITGEDGNTKQKLTTLQQTINILNKYDK